MDIVEDGRAAIKFRGHKLSRKLVDFSTNRHTFSTRPNNIDFSGVASESRRDLRGTSIDFSAFDPHSGRGGVGLMDESEEEEEEFV
ncbi:hypothetical protein BC937DRAFT_89531 [Endogone sp. FLAS-F59071]|nr:hypothetical protein BC937DRAFT_89531 [Endogone sp. FLAS-F59071]|eukprot:RUS22364.1 hypothetical protein BC937DRAFT_89531 [Endogone sp. FLAS-F59071]